MLANRHYKTGLRLLLAFIVGLSSFLSQPQPTWACKCTPSASPSSALAQADAVFVGTVVAVLNPTKLPYYDKIAWFYIDYFPNANYQNLYLQLIIFKVENSWKGTTDAYVAVQTGTDSMACGYQFSQGQQYVVYSHNYRGHMWTNMCTRTTEFNHAAEDLAYLQMAPTLAIAPSGLPQALCQVGLGIVLLLLATCTFWIIRRKRRVKAEVSGQTA